LITTSLDIRNAPEETKTVLQCLEKGTASDGGYYEIKYGFGDLLVNAGIFTLPGTTGQPGVLRDPCGFCGEFQKQFDVKRPVPLLLNLTKNVEVFRIFKDAVCARVKKKIVTFPPRYRTVPINLRKPGELIGLFETLRTLLGRPPHYGPFYVSAGSRNCHILLPLESRFSTLAETLVGRHTHIRDQYKELDAETYRIDTKSNLTGIASDWRVVRHAAADSRWTASLLMLPDSFVGLARDSAAASIPAPPHALHTLFRAGFDQLQDALAAFTPPQPFDQDSDTSIFMNIGKASVPTMMDHLRLCLAGEQFVHCVVGEQDVNGPWPALLQKVREIDEFEITSQGYVPVILEPRKLTEQFPGPGFVSFVHPLAPQGLYIELRPNQKWLEGFKQRIRGQLLEQFVEVYPLEGKNRDDLAELQRINPQCWPAFELLPGGGRSSVIQSAKLSRETCLSEFMTLRFSQQARARYVAGQFTT
jgi:hypothetical protein